MTRPHASPDAPALRPRAPRRPIPACPVRLRHKLMLLAAFEILVFGFAQSGFQPLRRGVVIEIPVVPRHVVT